jgi:predicted permease
MACANLANLMLARAGARDREVGVRVAIGASRAALVRQFLAESLLLAGCAALLAIVFAKLLSNGVLWAISTQGASPDLVVPVDWRVIVFATAIGLGTCIMFGLAPALRAIRIPAAAAMRTGGRGATAGHEKMSVQRMMVTTQIAISLVLLVAALLFVRSFRNLMTVDPGVRQEGIVAVFVEYPEALVPRDRQADFRREVLADVKTLPGVVNAGITTHVPLIGGSWSHGIRVGPVSNSAQFTWASPGYFETMDIPILRGRDFTLRDTVGSPRVAVVNQAFVRMFIGQGEPLGQTLHTGEEPDYPSTIYEIVGVIADTRYNDVRGEVRPIVYAPDSQLPASRSGMQMVIHASVVPGSAIAAVRELMRQKYPALLVEFSVLQQRVRDGLVRDRLLAVLAGFFGLLAILLTIVGLYGMLSYSVAQRRPEIGVRLALGARWGNVVGLVMREAGWLLAIGSVLGVGLAVLAGRSAASLLFGVTPGDLPTLTGACLLLSVIAAVASFLPARRAASLDPVEVLREG